MFEDHSIINFTKNSAEIQGGAIYVENNGLSKSACFYQISDYMHPKLSKVYLSDNRASKAGTVLFGGKIQCEMFNIPTILSREIFEEIAFDYSAQTGPLSNIIRTYSDVCQSVMLTTAQKTALRHS